MNKGDQTRTLDGHLVVLERILELPGYTHPLIGWIHFRYPGIEWTKQNWTLMGKVDPQGELNSLDLDWNYYVTTQ